MKRLIHSAKFWLLVLDVSISTIAFFLTLFLRPDDVVKVMGLIATWQPVFVFIIKAIADEDVAKSESAGWATYRSKSDTDTLTTISEDTPK
jgi:hypothetical protein